jgi:hypothetical protein
MFVETSRDCKTWTVLHSLGSPVKFKSKKDAKKWFQLLEEANWLDWKVGFLHRYTNGIYYRLVTKSGKEIKY